MNVRSMKNTRSSGLEMRRGSSPQNARMKPKRSELDAFAAGDASHRTCVSGNPMGFALMG
jgi:hypothetical protein